MKLIQINVDRMQEASVSVLSKNEALVKKMPELDKSYQKMLQKRLIIDQNRQLQETDFTGLTQAKVKKRDELIKAVLRITSGLIAYANSVEDVTLKTKVNYKPSNLNRAADSVLFEIANLINNLATPLTAELEKFLISEAEVKRFGELIIEYKSSIPLKRVATTETKASTANISAALEEINHILKNEIDVMMNLFRDSEPDFYNSYKNARIVVEYSGRGKGKEDLLVVTE